MRGKDYLKFSIVTARLSRTSASMLSSSRSMRSIFSLICCRAEIVSKLHVLGVNPENLKAANSVRVSSWDTLLLST